jgi:hypothetical protein
LIEDNKFYREQLQRQQQQMTAFMQQFAALQAALSGAQPPPPSPAPAQPAAPAVPVGPPRPEQFATHEEYVQAIADFRAEQKVQQAFAQRDAQLRAQQEAALKAQEEARLQDRVRAWEAKLAAGRAQFPNFDFVIGNPALTLAPPVQGAVVETVLESPVGPAILHYLGSHPDVTAHLNQLSPWGAARLLGEVEALFRTPPPVAETPAPPQARPASPPPQAPAVVPAPLPPPLQPVGGGQAPATPGTFQPGMPLAAYERMRQQQRSV